MDDRDMKRLGIVLGLGLLGFLILSQAYQAGVATGLARDGDGSGAGPHGGFGFFPFPPFLLLVGGAILFVVWRRRWSGDGPGGQGRGPGGGRPPRMVEEWHRRMHEAETPPAANTATENGNARTEEAPGTGSAGGGAGGVGPAGSGPAAGGMV